jgi:hypothetical protein
MYFTVGYDELIQGIILRPPNRTDSVLLGAGHAVFEVFFHGDNPPTLND